MREPWRRLARVGERELVVVTTSRRGINSHDAAVVGHGLTQG